MGETIHVLPIGDSAPHRDDGTPCWCRPRAESVSDDLVVVHHSADGRELHELEEMKQLAQDEITTTPLTPRELEVLALQQEVMTLRARLAKFEAEHGTFVVVGSESFNARRVQALLARLAEVERERDEWKNAIIDAAVVSWTYQEKHESSPRLAVNALLEWTTQVALDPAVSEPAAALARARDVFESMANRADMARAAAEARATALAAALAKYGRHLDTCATSVKSYTDVHGYFTVSRNLDAACDCDLSAALDAAKGAG